MLKSTFQSLNQERQRNPDSCEIVCLDSYFQIVFRDKHQHSFSCMGRETDLFLVLTELSSIQIVYHVFEKRTHRRTGLVEDEVQLYSVLVFYDVQIYYSDKERHR